MVKEKYYAIRIGTPRKHSCYFRLSCDDATPQLFVSREEAKHEKQKMGTSGDFKVVRVEVVETKGR